MKHKVDYCRYTFEAEDDWGDYDNGKYRKPIFNKKGYSIKHYRDKNGKLISLLEHIAKWEYFNGEIPEGIEIDHIIPVKNGGTNKLSNLRLVTRKGNMNNPFTKENLSEAKKGNQWNKGIKQSEEQIRKRAEKIKGKKHPLESVLRSANAHKKAIVQLSKENVFIKYWDSAADASRELGVSEEGIGRVCNNKLKTSGGFIWKYRYGEL